VKWRSVIIVATVLATTLLLWRHKKIADLSHEADFVSTTPHNPRPILAVSKTNLLGDCLTDLQDQAFLSEILPATHEFFSKLDRLGLSPLRNEVQPDSCSKIRIIKTPNGIVCPFVIDDIWTVEFMRGSSFSGVTHFGQRGADNPFRAISHADTDALNRLSKKAVAMPEVEVWKIASRVADAFGIDPSKFERPRMYEESLFNYHLGIYTIEYRKKGSDPINQMNYTHSFSLKATSRTGAILVSYSHLEAALP
jgi:hypothetical protein